MAWVCRMPDTEKELQDCVHNLMGVFDNPIAWRQINKDFAEEAWRFGREDIPYHHPEKRNSAEGKSKLGCNTKGILGQCP